MKRRYVVPVVGRAGLGNELFPLVRAICLAEDKGLVLLRPSWLKLRIGPYARREADKREYWRLFREPTLRERVLRAFFRLRWHRSSHLRDVDTRAVVLSGMDDYFASFTLSSGQIRDYLEELCRTGTIQERAEREYISIHVRLGDFAPAGSSDDPLQENNRSTSIDWFASVVGEIRSRWQGVPIVVSSDGTDEELAPLLGTRGVERSDATNALDEMFILSRACGIVGSRSTFSAWGAFLGDVPMIVQMGGNVYAPHERVWEEPIGSACSSWLDAVEWKMQDVT